MIRTPAFLPAAAAGLLLACSAAGPAAAVATPGPDSPAAAFLRAVHQGNLTEIAGGADTRRDATTACVRRIGASLVRDHTALDKAVKALAAKLHLRLPASPDAKQLSGLAATRSEAGRRGFDTSWLRMQILGHQQTLGLLNREISAASPADLAAAARAARPIITRHLAMLQACGIAAPSPMASGRMTMPGPMHTMAGGMGGMRGTNGMAATAAPGPVRAGLGGTSGHAGLGLPLATAGGVLAASGAGWALRRRRTAR